MGDIAGPMSVTAPGYAGVVTWGSAGPAPILTVSGGKGADAWVFGDVSGTVSSGSGSASLTALGSALSTNVTGASDAYFFSAGSALNTTVSAGQHAGAVTLGNFDGSVTAGSDAWLLSEGSINGSLSALKDGLVYASGSVTGGFSAGRDIGVISYGAITAGVSAGRDVVFVRAVGNLDGVISAGHDIGGPWVDPDGLGAVSSYSAIGSNPSISTTIIAGHDIASVVAVGSINGSINATDSINAIRSGNAITATISAANTVPITQFDLSLTNLSPPTTPASSAASLLAVAASAKAQVLADVADVLASFTTTHASLATSKADAANALSAAITNFSTAVTNAQTAISQNEQAAFLNGLAVEQKAQQAELDAAFQNAAELMDELDANLETQVKVRQAEFDLTQGIANQAPTKLAEADAQMDVMSKLAQDQFQIREDQFLERGKAQQQRVKASITEGPSPYSNCVNEFIGEWIIRPTFTDRFLVNATDTQLLMATTALSTSIVVGIWFAPGALTVGGLTVSAPVAAGLFAAGDHLVLQTALYYISDGQSGGPTAQGTAFAFAGGAVGQVVISRLAKFFHKTPSPPKPPKIDESAGGEFVDDAIRMTEQQVAPSTPGGHGLKDIIKQASGWSPGKAGDYFGWIGRDVIKGAKDFTKADLLKNGFTKDALEKMAEAYEAIAKMSSSTGNLNPSAASRAAQLREILKELF